MHQGIFGLIVLCTFGKMECWPQVEWTLYTTGKHWNEGQLVCWIMGGKLGSPDTAQDKVAMDYFINNQPWKTKAGNIYTLFLDMGKRPGSGTGLRWNDCAEVLDVWEISGVDPTLDGCAGISPRTFQTSQQLSTAACYDQKRKYICEVEVSPICPYEKVVGRPTTTSIAHISVLGDAECEQLCTDDDACRGYVYDAKCETYSDQNNPMLFEAGANIDKSQAQVLTHYKKCYLSSMVEEGMDLTSPTSFTPFPFACGTYDPPATVYTVFSDSVTWLQAKDVCSSLNASMAVINSTTTFEVIKGLLDDPSFAYHWVGYQEVNGPPALWLTGDAVQDVTQMSSPNVGPVACGSTHLETGANQLHSCITKLPYVCQHTAGHCHFASTPAITAQRDYYVDLGSKPMEECFQICESRRNLTGGAGCYAFITKLSGQSTTDVCLTLDFGSWEESFTTAGTWLENDPEKTLWRFTCVTVAVNNFTKILQEEEITSTAMPTNFGATGGVNPAATTPTSTNAATSELASLPMGTTTPSSPPLQGDSTTSPPPTSTKSTPLDSTASPPVPSTLATDPAAYETTSISYTQRQTTLPPYPPPNESGTTLQTIGLCPCPCLNSSSSYPNPEDFQNELASLHISAESTGAAYRKKNSIMDNRPESTGMGTVACAFLASVLGVVLCFDVINFFSPNKRVRVMYRQ